MEHTKVSKAVAIYRELKRDGQKLPEFKTEYDALTEGDKLELAQGCARNLGLTQEQCDFPLNGAVAQAQAV